MDHFWRAGGRKPYSGVTAPPLVVRAQGSDRSLKPGPAYLVGRDPLCDIVISDAHVSWQHAMLRLENGGWVLADNGSTNGIVWAHENGGSAVLHAYDAGNLAHELYNSNQAASGRDSFGAGNKFITPTIADGKVFVGTTNGVAVFGLL